ncbi:MAG: GNAT family N-acetyltransferase, partial [Lachnospiraceae bacterium]|nr:GNAT family N-acetyltransferase [Lachnospiraceae bacterium]
MEIRLIKEPELLPALHLVWEVFAQEIAPACTPQGVESFQKFIKYEYISQVWYRKDLLFFGAFDNERICGTLALRPDGHIALFFVEQKSQGKGIGRMLFQTAYNYCANELKADRMTVNAAPGAVERYSRLGMRAVSGEQERDGIRSIPMEMYVNLAMGTPVRRQSKAVSEK